MKRKIIWGIALLAINAIVIVSMYTIPFRYHRKVDLPLEVEADKYALFFLGYVRCPSICPTTLQIVSKLYREDNKMPPFTFINLEDVPPNGATALEYAQSFHPSFKAWQPDSEQRKQILKEFGAFYAEAQPSIGKAANHSTAIYLLLKEGNSWYIEGMYTKYPPQVSELQEEIVGFVKSTK